jgi:predicted nucleic acid-binding protein
MPPVANASPLIFLAKGGHVDLLQVAGDRLWVPSTVTDEILARGPEDVTARALRETEWIEIVSSPEVPSSIQSWDLGPGEASVLAIAHGNPEQEVIIDDLAARRCAETLDIPFRGTLGIVLGAKQSGRIPKARPVVEELLRNGMYLSQDVIDSALALVDE